MGWEMAKANLKPLIGIGMMSKVFITGLDKTTKSRRHLIGSRGITSPLTLYLLNGSFLLSAMSQS